MDQGFQDADVIVEHETFTCPIHQGYIGPHTGTALWNNDGTLTIWSSSQGTSMCAIRPPVSSTCPCPWCVPFLWRSAGALGEDHRLRRTGGSSAGARAGRPVKVTMSRTDVFEPTATTSGTQVRVKIGATKNGRLVAEKPS